MSKYEVERIVVILAMKYYGKKSDHIRLKYRIERIVVVLEMYHLYQIRKICRVKKVIRDLAIHVFLMLYTLNNNQSNVPPTTFNKL